MFWPTDDAIRSLPRDMINKLQDPLRVLDLIHFVQYHVVVHIQVRVEKNDFFTFKFSRLHCLFYNTSCGSGTLKHEDFLHLYVT